MKEADTLLSQHVPRHVARLPKDLARFPIIWICPRILSCLMFTSVRLVPPDIHEIPYPWEKEGIERIRNHYELNLLVHMMDQF